VAAPIYISANRAQGYIFSTFSPALVTYYLFAILTGSAPYGFDLHYLDD